MRQVLHKNCVWLWIKHRGWHKVYQNSGDSILATRWRRASVLTCICESPVPDSPLATEANTSVCLWSTKGSHLSVAHFSTWFDLICLLFVYNTFCAVIIAYSFPYQKSPGQQLDKVCYLLYVTVFFKYQRKYLLTIECSLCCLEMELNQIFYINRQLEPSTSSTK